MGLLLGGSNFIFLLYQVTSKMGTPILDTFFSYAIWVDHLY
jgi:hypothetical protein